jgi:UDP-N-acetylglucosamine 2-epimerase
MRKVISVVGARPNFVKLAPLHRQLVRLFTHKVIHTGQHYDYTLSGTFFKEFRLPKPFANLGVGSGPPGWQTGEMIARTEGILATEAPDLVVVYGDTNSTLAGALAAVKMHIPVAHVEAGVRSFDMSMPEEVNRVLVDRISEFLLCPTKNALANLDREGLESKSHLTGDVMVEPLLRSVKSASCKEALKKHALSSGEYALVTLHRAENTDNPRVLGDIAESLSRLDQEVVFPMHPRTKKALEEAGLIGVLKAARNLRIIRPVPYSEFVALERCAGRILTDSGGVQKEAYILGVPCITLRENTEWPETLAKGWNVLVGHSRSKLSESLKRRPSAARNPSVFGDTGASARIARLLARLLP